MDFSLPPDLIALRDRTRSFVRDVLIPLENDPRQGPHGPTDDFRREMAAINPIGFLGKPVTRRTLSDALRGH